MYKRFFAISIALAVCCIMHAQVSKTFTYFSRTGISNLGEEAPAAYDCAIFVPAEYAGKQISKVKFLLVNPSLLVNPKMWISSKLPDTPESADGICTDITNSVGYDQDFTTVTLDKPCTIPEGGCYVGYSFSITNASSYDGKYPVITGLKTEPAVNGGHYLRASLTVKEWTNMQGMGFGNLTTTVTITGDFPKHGATVAPAFAKESRAIKNKGGMVTLTVYGEGTTAVSSLDYTVTNTATGKSYDMHADLGDNTIEFDNNRTVNVPINAEETSGFSDMKIVVNKVNGEPNPFTNNVTATGKLLSLAAESKRMIVEEEFTATGCGYCPRGITAMRMLKERYPDSFIGIAVHDQQGYVDPMKITEYNSVVSKFSAGLPSATLNRISTFDPYYGSANSTSLPFGVKYDYEEILQVPVECSVDVTPTWEGNDYNKIKVNTDITFQYNISSAPYSIAYVVVADGLSIKNVEDEKEKERWLQRNYLGSDMSIRNDENLQEWISKPAYIADIEFNDVAVAAVSVTNGLRNVIKAPIVEGVAQSHEYTIDLTGNKLVQDKSKLRVVAMLINTKTGEIVNADEKALAYDGPSGIESIRDNSNITETARYTIDGRQTNGKGHGLTIVRMSDGTTHKVVVK